MTMSASAKQITAEEFEAMPDEAGTNSELIHGEIVRTPYPEWMHGYVVANLIGVLGRAVDRRVGAVYARCGFILARNPDTVLGPDLSIRLGPAPASGDEAEYWTEEVPEIVFEVVSKFDLAETLEEKIHLYLEAGVKSVVVVWPRLKRVTVRTPHGDSSLGTSDLLTFTDLPGMSVAIDEIFSSPVAQ